MAGDWMKIQLELPDKPEVHYIATVCKLDPDSVVGKLIRVWQWFNKHTTDGNAHGVTFALVDRLVGVTGFGEAMQFAGWLEQRDTSLIMPKFERHTSESSKKRALSAERQSRFRNAPGVMDALPREEKRRVLKTTTASAEAEPEFELAWKAYPKRAGGNPKGRALKAWRARRKEGTDVADLKAGVIRYAAFIRATGKDGTEFIMQAATFFGPDRQFLEPWNPPQEKAKPVEWWASDAAAEAKGQELGLSPRAGEGWPQFKDRIRAKLNERIAA